MTIVKEYLEYTEKWQNEYGEKTLVLMQVGSFFESYGLLDKDNNIYGSNITNFAEICDMTVSRKNLCVGKAKVVMAGFGLAQLEKYVKKLQENGYTVVIYTQDSPSKNTTRSLHTIFSPGTYFSNDTKELSNNITCIWIHYSPVNILLSEQITIGIANIDIYTGKTSVFEFFKEYIHNPTTYDELERYISIYNPNECIIISNLEESIIDDVIKFTSINSSKIHKINIDKEAELGKLAKNAEKQTYQQEIIKQFYPNNSVDILFNSLQTYCIAIQSFIYLLDFVYRHNPNLVNIIDEPIIENYTDRLVLANHSLKQLNIIQDNRYTGKYSCVSNLLNNCVTSMGKRSFLYNLLNPITDIEILKESYEITEYLLKNNWESFRSLLNDIRDIEKLKRKLIMKKITPKDFTILNTNFKTIDVIYKRCKDDKVIMRYLQKYNIGNISELCKKYEKEIERNLEISKAKYIDDISLEKLGNNDINNIFFIKTGLDEKIDNCYKKSLDCRKQFETIRKFLSDLIMKFEKSTKTTEFVKIHETAKMDPIFLVTKRRSVFLKKAIEEISNNTIFKDKLINDENIKLKYFSDFSKKEEIFVLNLKYIQLNSHGGNQSSIIINSPEISKIASLINTSKGDLINELEMFYYKFLNKFMENNLSNIISFVIQIDTLQCKCYIAEKFNYCKPEIIKNNKSFLEFKELRHCLIEHLNTREIYVTNDLKMGEEMDGILLYGTNAVGKTSLIKSIGISIIMAQAGLYVPCSEFKYFPYNTIFTRILGNDNLFKGLSTFAVEMSELRTILKYADKNSIILGDELCSGTESDSALSIFVAGLEILHERKCTFLFATHFHEVVKYDEILELERLQMFHMSVIFDSKNNKLVYDRKLKLGAGESMYGLEVCKSLNLPNDFLDRAHSLRIKYNEIYKNILGNNTSKYNSNKIKNLCELCNKNIGSEIHHLDQQKNAGKNGFINSFHKNHSANLINICENCHNNVHKNESNLIIQKTTNGYEINEKNNILF